MSFQISKQQVSLSWRFCEQYRLVPQMHTPNIIIPPKKVQQRIKQNQLLANTFSEYIQEIKSYLDGNYVFTLVDPEGVMLLIDFHPRIALKISHYPVYCGVSLEEKSCGTNAVSLSMKYNDFIFLRPEQHYCYFLKDWAGCAVPLQVSGKPLGYLCMASLNQSLSKETHIMLQLLASKLENAFEQHDFKSNTTLQLTDVQKHIIRLMSTGLTEKAIGLQMNLNINTIKYHKKNIFHKLNAQSSTEVIAKAIKLGIISLEELQQG